MCGKPITLVQRFSFCAFLFSSQQPIWAGGCTGKTCHVACWDDDTIIIACQAWPRRDWWCYCKKTTQSKPTGTANWRLKCCVGQLSTGILAGVARQALTAIHQLTLNVLTTTASYQAFIGQITSPICPRCDNGSETAERLLLRQFQLISGLKWAT